MSGERNLGRLLSEMKPVLHGDELVYCCIDAADLLQWDEPPIMMFKEEEATTLILRRSVADRMSIKYNSTWSMITLSVHSDLEAVGFLAEVSKHLAMAGISVNVVSAYYHDHLLVPVEKAQSAMDVLQKLSQRYHER